MKYNLSLSTIRRRIKKQQLVYKVENGRYWIADMEPKAHDEHRPSQGDRSRQEVMSLTDEIWKLKSEIVDLKTLIAVLEDEISRIKAQLPSLSSEGQTEKTIGTTYSILRRSSP